jgi:hypothetical protein
MFDGIPAKTASFPFRMAWSVNGDCGGAQRSCGLTGALGVRPPAGPGPGPGDRRPRCDGSRLGSRIAIFPRLRPATIPRARSSSRAVEPLPAAAGSSPIPSAALPCRTAALLRGERARACIQRQAGVHIRDQPPGARCDRFLGKRSSGSRSLSVAARSRARPEGVVAKRRDQTHALPNPGPAAPGPGRMPSRSCERAAKASLVAVSLTSARLVEVQSAGPHFAAERQAWR